MGHDSSLTGATLFDLLDNPSDPQAWARFVGRYGPKIHAWCVRWRLQTADAEEVTQAVLVKLWEKMTGTYERGKGSFRGWLRRVTERVWYDLLDDRRRTAGAGGDTFTHLLNNHEARDTFELEVEQEHRRTVLEAALARLRLRLSARDWAIFEALDLNGRPARDVAGEQGMKVAAVYEVRSRAKARLREEVQLLDPEEGTEGRE